MTIKSSHPKVFLGKGVLKKCNKFTGEHPCRSVISIKLLCSFIEITFRHGCSPADFLHIFRTSFPKNTPVRLVLEDGDVNDGESLLNNDGNNCAGKVKDDSDDVMFWKFFKHFQKQGQEFFITFDLVSSPLSLF